MSETPERDPDATFTSVVFQPASKVDALTEDGQELTQKPYPFHVDWEGNVLNAEAVSAHHMACKRVVGLQFDIAVQRVDLYWPQVRTNPYWAQNRYIVTEDDHGNYASHVLAIEEVAVYE